MLSHIDYWQVYPNLCSFVQFGVYEYGAFMVDPNLLIRQVDVSRKYRMGIFNMGSVPRFPTKILIPVFHLSGENHDARHLSQKERLRLACPDIIGFEILPPTAATSNGFVDYNSTRRIAKVHRVILRLSLHILAFRTALEFLYWLRLALAAGQCSSFDSLLFRIIVECSPTNAACLAYLGGRQLGVLIQLYRPLDDGWFDLISPRRQPQAPFSHSSESDDKRHPYHAFVPHTGFILKMEQSNLIMVNKKMSRGKGL
jgi:hypothetical protein